MTRVSVCMATYNGALYLEEQLESIVVQLGADDEVIVCDDCSTDVTSDNIRRCGDSRVKLVRNSRRLGHVKNFEKAMTLAGGCFIALSDQDDIWAAGRLNSMMNTLAPLPLYALVVCDLEEIDGDGHTLEVALRLPAGPTHRLLQTIRILLGRERYFGCCFMFRRELLRRLLPIPSRVEAHDIWIGLKACMYGRIVHTGEIGLKRRIHGNNLTPVHRRKLYKVLRSRLVYLYYCSAGIFK
jgi:glycosyltransferase involved in cell wall biosynthesis